MVLSTSKHSQHIPCIGATSYNVFNSHSTQALISALLSCVPYSMTWQDKLISLFGRLASEEALIASGLPYVILRCGDLIGPRDTTYRWWQYQVTWTSGFPRGIWVHFLVFEETWKTCKASWASLYQRICLLQWNEIAHFPISALSWLVTL